MYDMTAAHRTLPFGTRVMVTNLENGRAATVRINDRGPFVGDRIIDLSYAAARVLGIDRPGHGPGPAGDPQGRFPAPGRRGMVGPGGFLHSKENAAWLVQELEARLCGRQALRLRDPAQVYYRVRVAAPDEASARALARRLNADGYVVLVLESQGRLEDRGHPAVVRAAPRTGCARTGRLSPSCRSGDGTP